MVKCTTIPRLEGMSLATLRCIACQPRIVPSVGDKRPNTTWVRAIQHDEAAGSAGDQGRQGSPVYACQEDPHEGNAEKFIAHECATCMESMSTEKSGSSPHLRSFTEPASRSGSSQSRSVQSVALLLQLGRAQGVRAQQAVRKHTGHPQRFQIDATKQ